MPTVTIDFTKVWQGDDEGNAVAAIEVRDGDSLVGTVADGASLDITNQQGTSLDIQEILTTDLPASCTITDTTWTLDGASFVSPLVVPASHDHDTVYALTATNTVTCETGGGGSGTVAKAWTGDEVDLDGVEVTFTATIGDGEPFTMHPATPNSSTSARP